MFFIQKKNNYGWKLKFRFFFKNFNKFLWLNFPRRNKPRFGRDIIYFQVHRFEWKFDLVYIFCFFSKLVNLGTNIFLEQKKCWYSLIFRAFNHRFFSFKKKQYKKVYLREETEIWFFSKILRVLGIKNVAVPGGRSMYQEYTLIQSEIKKKKTQKVVYLTNYIKKKYPAQA